MSDQDDASPLQVLEPPTLVKVDRQGECLMKARRNHPMLGMLSMQVSAFHLLILLSGKSETLYKLGRTGSLSFLTAFFLNNKSFSIFPCVERDEIKRVCL